MGWLGDGSHTGQGCPTTWTVVGLPSRYPHFKLKLLGDCPAAGNLLSLDAMYRKFINTIRVQFVVYIDTSFILHLSWLRSGTRSLVCIGLADKVGVTVSWPIILVVFVETGDEWRFTLMGTVLCMITNNDFNFTIFSQPYLVRSRLCYSVASVAVCLLSVRNVLWLNRVC